MQEGEGVFGKNPPSVADTGDGRGGGTGLGSLRLLSPMHGRYYGEKTQAGCFEKNAGRLFWRKTQAGKSGEREQADTGLAETAARTRQEGEDGVRGNSRED